jgi:LPS-assembly lipoprotein
MSTGAAPLSTGWRRGPRTLIERAWLVGLLLALFVAVGTGCGFQLRGPIAVPAGVEPIHLQAAGLIRQALEDRLEASTVQLTAAPQEAGLILRILDQSRSSRVVAVDRGGKALAFALEYWVRFDAVKPTGEQVVAPRALNLERTFDDNPDVAVLGKQLESEIIYQDLADDAADQILMSLRAGLGALER